ncbi:hypothetical protein [Heyndrickxia oleronia]|uniref:hypothetical protein n=1 Tax=Heyndrickxia oleronia TaxID=38875 RepID=UPI001C0EAE0C|nr:hypothetical protein [Heyndrickxia oleronia]MBU5211055.1 hypothetical protein [Heyndrickxia oleronia]
MNGDFERYIYDRITEELERVIGEYRYDRENFRNHVRRWQREDLRAFRDWLDGVLDRSNYKLECLSGDLTSGQSRLTWREIKVIPRKFKSCACCGRIFYDLSRNGRTAVCHYETYRWWNQSKRRYQYRYKAGRPMSVCEVERDDAKGSVLVDTLGGRATGYRYTTRMRLERQLIVWTSFQPDNDAEEAFIRKIELAASPYAINGRYKPAMVNATEWPAKGASKPENYYGNYREVREAEKQSGRVERFNIYDLTWDEVVVRGLDRYFDEKIFYEKQRISVKTA